MRYELPAGIALVLICAASVCQADTPRFEERIIDPNCGNICYAVTLADVDGDGKQDLVAVTENRVLWYRQPAKNADTAEWTKHVVIADKTERDNVCIAPHDIDGDGKIDFALGAGWTKVGTIQWLSRGKTLDESWSVHFIDKEPWLHRMRFADVLGTGKPQLTISPLNKTQGDGVRLSAFEIPKDPKSDRWTRTLLDDRLNRMHNHWHVALLGGERPGTLTASQEGISFFTKHDQVWERRTLSAGASGEKPELQGTGEVKVGRRKDGTRFLVTVEPMHGNCAVVYTPPAAGETQWKRSVLDDTLRRGHAVWAADLDGDGNDEFIVGHSDPSPGPTKGPGVRVFRKDERSETWAQTVIDDGGMATEDLVADDLTGDGRIDIVAGGRNTHNIKLYVNRGK